MRYKGGQGQVGAQPCFKRGKYTKIIIFRAKRKKFSVKPFSKGLWGVGRSPTLERSAKIRIQNEQPPRAFFGLIPKNAGEKFSQRKLVAEACSVRQKEALFTDKPALFAKEFPENPYCKSYQNPMFPLNSNFLKKIAKSA